MRKLVLTVAAALPTLAAALLVSPGAMAMMPGVTNAVRSIEKVACYGYGWRGWGIYPGWYPACDRLPVYVTPEYVAPAPVYVAPAPAYPAPRRCWVQPGADGRQGYWQAC
jgi:hypothetical protein